MRKMQIVDPFPPNILQGCCVPDSSRSSYTILQPLSSKVQCKTQTLPLATSASSQTARRPCVLPSHSEGPWRIVAPHTSAQRNLRQLGIPLAKAVLQKECKTGTKHFKNFKPSLTGGSTSHRGDLSNSVGNILQQLKTSNSFQQVVHDVSLVFLFAYAFPHNRRPSY